MIETEAWVLNSGANADLPTLEVKQIKLSALEEDEVLVESLYGCWEGNMGHGYSRSPIDICLARKEDYIVMGNAGVVRVLQCGAKTEDSFKEGDICVLVPNGVIDAYGYPKLMLGYDAKGTVGVLAKRLKLKARQMVKVPPASGMELAKWAAFSVRYITAWANWEVTLRCWRSQMQDEAPENHFVASWGGGVGFGELQLAQAAGFNVVMMASKRERLDFLREYNINSIDRSKFSEMNFDEDRYQSDADFRATYKGAEDRYMSAVRELTDGRGFDIIIDNIGRPVYRATLKSLARQGVVTTCGWKEGMKLSHLRAIEGISRHLHVHTHYAKLSEAEDAVAYALENDWMPRMDLDQKIYDWDEIHCLAQDYVDNKIIGYFPVYKVSEDPEV